LDWFDKSLFKRLGNWNVKFFLSNQEQTLDCVKSFYFYNV